MLAELSIDDLVLIAAARLEFSPGLNVITGETGAGKSLLAQAIGLLMGQKGGDELVRPGAARALVQALFENGDDTLAVARELPRGGRSRARMDGLLSSAAAVEDALRRRLAFYGQLEHTRLLQLERQLDLLDGAVADEVEPLKAAYAEAYARRARAHARARRPARRRPRPRARARHAALPGRARSRRPAWSRERTSASPSTASGRGTPASCSSAPAARSPCWPASPRPPPSTACAWRSAWSTRRRCSTRASRRWRSVSARSPWSSTTSPRRCATTSTGSTSTPPTGTPSSFATTSSRRSCASTAARPTRCSRTSRRRAPGSSALEEFAADEESLVAKVTAAQDDAVAAAARLSAARRRLAPQVAARIEEELRGLAMPHATFVIEVTARGDGWDGLGPHGADDVEFVFGANPGVPPRPLRETASGGELSRAMLAIRGLVNLGDDVETLIFDEVDTGIGGVTAAALGERLRRLAERRQVLCITHLPQVAAFADRQFAIAKESDVGEGTTETVVRLVEGEERLAELCRMLGAAPDDDAARSHAESLLAKASATA